MFSKMLIFVFSMVGVFALLFGFIPGQFFAADLASSVGVDPAIAEYYDVRNVTMYSYAGADNMTFPYSSMDDNPPTSPDWEAGLPTNQYFEVWWGEIYFGGVWLDLLMFRHVEEVWWGRSYHIMSIYQDDKITPVQYVNRIYYYTVNETWNDEWNASLFYASCDHVSSNIFVGYNQSKYSSISDAFLGGELNYVLSYEYDWNQTNINAWTILGQLLTFQSPSLGIPGIAGTIFNTVIAIPFWIMITILIIKLVQSMIPLIKGTDD